MAVFPSWATANPFNKADRQQSQSGTPPQPNQKKKQEVDLNTDDPNANKRVNPKGGQGDDPMAQLESLWQPNVDKDGKEIPDESEDNSSFMPSLDQKKLKDMIGKMNFTDGITSAEVEAIKTGGEGALGAFANMLNRAGRKSFETAFAASSKLAEQGFTRAQARFQKGIPNHVREMMVENGLSESVALTSNPMFKPLVSSVKNQYLKKFPKATPQEVNQGVKKYFDAMEAEFGKNKQKQQQDSEATDPGKKLRQGDPTADFESWLGDEIGSLSKGGMFQDDGTNEENQE